MDATVIGEGAGIIKCIGVGAAITYVAAIETIVISCNCMRHIIIVGPCNRGALGYGGRGRAKAHVVNAYLIAVATAGWWCVVTISGAAFTATKE